jgi:hypothetical protein
MPIDDLIYDVGMNNGDDSAYYLSLGFRTITRSAKTLFAPSTNSPATSFFGRLRVECLNETLFTSLAQVACQARRAS